MPNPTLRQISGLPDAASTLADSALVMIDLQNTYRSGTMALVGVEEALHEAQTLLRRAREAGTPIVHIKHDAGVGSPYDVTAENGQICDSVAPVAGETVIVKKYPNAFVGTDLDDRLKKLGVKNLILAGFMTHMCVNSTARGAFNLGYAPTIVDAATATRDLPGAGRNGATVDAASLHAASLAAVGDLFAVVVKRAADIPAAH
ncbi:MAG: cysteine hydrolase family protein [Vulcanimicrobiaceae bacterium]